MRLIIQRVSQASVTIENQLISQIKRGLLILIGIHHQDHEEQAAFLADKCLNLRIFNDDQNKMNLSLLDIKGEALVISNFTLYGDCEKGRRPSFTDAAPPEPAKKLYEFFVDQLKLSGLVIVQGIFGAAMKVDLCNEGPVTLMIEK